MTEEGRQRKPDETLQEHLAREDERAQVLRELGQDEAIDAERDKAIIAAVMAATLAALFLLPVWAAILGASWWVLRTLGGAPTPW